MCILICAEREREKVCVFVCGFVCVCESEREGEYVRSYLCDVCYSTALNQVPTFSSTEQSALSTVAQVIYKTFNSIQFIQCFMQSIQI